MTALTSTLRRAAPHRVVALGICTVIDGLCTQRHDLALDQQFRSPRSFLADDATWREAMSRPAERVRPGSHPELAVARTEIAAAQAAGQTARQRANPSIDLSLEHHSAPGQSDSPWTIGIALDSLVGEWLLGQSRRAALTELADARQLEAVERAAQVAWQLHAACAAPCVTMLRSSRPGRRDAGAAAREIRCGGDA
jgi:outer membrane protein TolC